MKCPNAEKGFCPAKEGMNVHTNEWWTQSYCMTCGYEGLEKFETARQIKRDQVPPPSPPRRKKSTSNQQY